MIDQLEKQMHRQRAIFDRVAKLGPAVVQAVKHRIERMRHSHGRGPDRRQGPSPSL